MENEKGTFTYTHSVSGMKYTAYSIAIVKIQNYKKNYSVRGYLVVKYADDITQTMYTDYNETDNSRSIAEVAYSLKTDGKAEYDTYTDNQKAIVDEYAAG